MFGKMRTIYGIAESHPSNLVEGALNLTGRIDVAYKLGLGDGKGFYQIPFFKFYQAITKSGAPVENVDFALKKLRSACGILQKERQIVEKLGPNDILYVEGFSKYPHPVSFVAKERGAKVVYLDDGFGPYEALINGTALNEEEACAVQAGREEHWLNQIRKNKPKFGRKQEFLLAGGCHLKPAQDDSDVGKIPEMLKTQRVSLQILYDTEEIVNSQN